MLRLKQVLVVFICTALLFASVQKMQANQCKENNSVFCAPNIRYGNWVPKSDCIDLSFNCKTKKALVNYGFAISEKNINQTISCNTILKNAGLKPLLRRAITQTYESDQRLGLAIYPLKQNKYKQ